MHIYIPDIKPDGVPEIWQPMYKHQSIESTVSTGKLERLKLLTNKLPVWSDEYKGFVLDFKVINGYFYYYY